MDCANVTEYARGICGEGDSYVMSSGHNLVYGVWSRGSWINTHCERVALGLILNVDVMNDDCVSSVDSHPVRSKGIVGYPEHGLVEGQRSVKQVELARLGSLIASGYPQAIASESSDHHGQ